MSHYDGDNGRGGDGSDQIYGGTSADKFVFGANETGSDTIMDFEDGFDKIHVGSFTGAEDITTANFASMVTITQVANSTDYSISFNGQTHTVKSMNGAALTLDINDFIV